MKLRTGGCDVVRVWGVEDSSAATAVGEMSMASSSSRDVGIISVGWARASVMCRLRHTRVEVLDRLAIKIRKGRPASVVMTPSGHEISWSLYIWIDG